MARTKIAVRVVLDSNAIYSEKAGHTLAGAVTRAFSKAREHDTLSVGFCLPAMALAERVVQIARQCAAWKDEGGEELRKALDLPIDLSKEAIKLAAQRQIDRQVEKYGLVILTPDLAQIDWPAVVRDASDRHAPFSGTEEKGFRDRIIGETFLQNLGDRSADRHFVFLTNDEDLGAFVVSKLGERPDVKIVKNVEQLLTFLDALANKEDTAAAIDLQTAAAELFYSQHNPEASLFLQWGLIEHIKKNQPPALRDVPSTYRRDEKFVIHPPEFVEHRNGRAHWLSRVVFKVAFWEIGYYNPLLSPTYRSTPASFFGSGVPLTSQPSSAKSIVESSSHFTSLPPTMQTDWPYGHAPLGDPSTFQKLVRTGLVEFRVNWTASVRKGELEDAALGPVQGGSLSWET